MICGPSGRSKAANNCKYLLTEQSRLLTAGCCVYLLWFSWQIHCGWYQCTIDHKRLMPFDPPQQTWRGILKITGLLSSCFGCPSRESVCPFALCVSSGKYTPTDTHINTMTEASHDVCPNQTYFTCLQETQSHLMARHYSQHMICHRRKQGKYTNSTKA